MDEMDLRMGLCAYARVKDGDGKNPAGCVGAACLEFASNAAPEMSVDPLARGSHVLNLEQVAGVAAVVP